MRRIATFVVALAMLEVINHYMGFQQAMIVGMCLMAGMMSEYMFGRR